MSATQKQAIENIKIKQFVTDSEGRRIAVTIDMKEYDRLRKILKLIPASEIWLYENPEAMESIEKGLKDAAKGRTSRLDLKDL